MFSIRKISPMVRAVGTVGAVAAIAGGITFAAQQTNTVALTGNEMDVTNNVLLISDGGAFGTSAAGFSNTNLILGTQGPKQPFYLQNLANATLSISVDIPNSPGSNGLDLSQVNVNFYDADGNLLASPTFAQLEAGPVTLPSGGDLNANAQGNGGDPGTNGNYSYSITVGSGAVSSNPANVPSFDLDFTGTST